MASPSSAIIQPSQTRPHKGLSDRILERTSGPSDWGYSSVSPDSTALLSPRSDAGGHTAAPFAAQPRAAEERGQ